MVAYKAFRKEVGEKMYKQNTEYVGCAKGRVVSGEPPRAVGREGTPPL